MEKYESVLKFKKYIVDEIFFKRNDEYELKEEGVPISLKIEPKIDIKEKDMNICLNIKICENSKINNMPFEMNIKLTGFFSVDENNPEIFKRNAIAILYPYVRAIVSTYTANANITPVILPTINVNKLIEEQEEKKN